MPIMRAAVLAVALLAGLAPAAQAAEPYPVRPVRIVILTLPGGPTDLMMRGIAGVLSQSLGQPFIVESRPGAEGMIAQQTCIAAPADGHTLCMTDAYTHNLNPLLRANMTYDPRTDLVPVIHLGFLPAGLFVPKSFPVNSMPELLARAKAMPGTINWTTFGRASSSYIYIEWLRRAKGIEITNIPYKSAQDGFRSLLSRESDVAIYALKAGMQNLDELKLLAVTSRERTSIAPDVPAFPEVGIEYSMGVWFGLAARKGTPDAIIQLLNKEIREKVIGNPEYRARYFDLGGLVLDSPAGKPVEDFAAYLKTEAQMFESLITAAGIGKE